MIATEARGKLGGHALQMQGGRCVAFRKSSPRKSLSQYQVQNKNLFRLCSAQWKNFTAAQRNAWNTQATKMSPIYSMGCESLMTGRELFFRCNMNNIFSHWVTIITPVNPNPIYVLPVTSTLFRTSLSSFLIYFSGSIPSGQYVYISCSRPMSPGQRWHKGDFRPCWYYAPGTTGSINIYNYVNGAWPVSIKIGLIVWIKIISINSAAAYPTMPRYVKATIIS